VAQAQTANDGRQFGHVVGQDRDSATVCSYESERIERVVVELKAAGVAVVGSDRGTQRRYRVWRDTDGGEGPFECRLEELPPLVRIGDVRVIEVGRVPAKPSRSSGRSSSAVTR